jgi:divalent metal cation (Fe/Co/Zn/Cd) transporter
VLSIAAVAITGWEPLDPLIALAVAVNIAIAGGGLVRRSAGGLMDRALGEDERHQMSGALSHFERDGVQFHALHPAGRVARVHLRALLVPGV